MTTIKLKNGSGAPTAGDLVQGEPALDLTNKRLYTENASGTVIEVGTNPGVDVTFADDRKAIFGTGSDFEIYHESSTGRSFIKETGADEFRILGSNIRIKNGGDSKTYMQMTDGGSVVIRHDDSPKLETTSTGIDVTGTVTADGLTVDGGNTLRLNAASTNDFFTIVQGGTQAVLTADSDAAANMLFKTASAGTDTSRMLIASGGDISFYEDTGTTAKFFWDSSAESLGIGTSNPAFVLDVNHASDNGLARFTSGDADAYITLSDVNSSSAYNKIGVITHDMYFNTNNAERMRIASNGDISFYEDTGTTAKLFWDASEERLGIGTSSPSAPLQVQTSHTSTDVTAANSNATLNVANSGAGNGVYNAIKFAANQQDMYIMSFNNSSQSSRRMGFFLGSVAGDAVTDERLSITGGGNVGINNTSPAATLHTVANSGTTALLTVGASGNNIASFYTSGSAQVMTLNSSGHLLVGTTDDVVQTNSGTGNGGIVLRNNNYIAVASDGSAALELNRLASTGEIANFRSDGTTVGSIGTAGGDLTIGTGDTGLTFEDAADVIHPIDTGTGAARDDAIDLGKSAARFDDIYATNGTIQTSDRNEKQDIEALSDAEQRVAVAAKGLLRKFRWKSSVADKGDDARIHFGIIAQDLQAAFEAEGLDAGRYAMFISTTWTDEETGEERTRMGVRYSELLAFIIAAI